MPVRPCTAHICLILALGGPLLSQSRFADGLARAMSEVIAAKIFMEEEQDEAEAFDGLSLLALPTVGHAGLGRSFAPASWFETPALFYPSDLLPADPGAGWDRRRRPPRPPPSAARRHALLQVFLF